MAAGGHDMTVDDADHEPSAPGSATVARNLPPVRFSR